VIHNGIVYCSGVVPTNWQTNNNVTEQTSDILKQIDAILEANGSSKGRILTMQIFLKDIKVRRGGFRSRACEADGTDEAKRHRAEDTKRGLSELFCSLRSRVCLWRVTGRLIRLLRSFFAFSLFFDLVD
jgi:hypothetical protein